MIRVVVLKFFWKILKVSQSARKIWVTTNYNIKDEAPLIMKNLFIVQENIRNVYIRAKEKKNTARYGLEIICYMNPYLYVTLPK